MNQPVRIAITGAAGQIGYQLCFRIAAGDLLGPEQPVVLQLLEIPQARQALDGVIMELNDCAFPLLEGVSGHDQAEAAFEQADVAILVGAKPRGPGMERKDLLGENGKIFAPQGRALNAAARRGVKVLVVGNPANTNCLIAQANAPDLDPAQFTAMTRLDHNRAIAQVAARTGVAIREVSKMIVWGNHSTTQVPDLTYCLAGERRARQAIGEETYFNDFIPTIQQRGAAVIKARGASSAASAASAAIDHVRDWILGSRGDDWVSMAVPADGSYGIAPGVIYSFPCTCRDGAWQIVHGLGIGHDIQERMQASDRELREERAAVEALLGRA